jgi:mannitol/fructose-specific phosphotransferase system IIA component (Ntr-type)
MFLLEDINQGNTIMKNLIIALSMFVAFGASAASDKELCQQYGRDLASNHTENQSVFLNELMSRSSNGSWGLSVEECNVYIQRGKHDFNFEYIDLINND